MKTAEEGATATAGEGATTTAREGATTAIDKAAGSPVTLEIGRGAFTIGTPGRKRSLLKPTMVGPQTRANPCRSGANAILMSINGPGDVDDNLTSPHNGKREGASPSADSDDNDGDGAASLDDNSLIDG